MSTYLVAGWVGAMATAASAMTTHRSTLALARCKCRCAAWNLDMRFNQQRQQSSDHEISDEQAESNQIVRQHCYYLLLFLFARKVL
jgi:hypothetical protein